MARENVSLLAFNRGVISPLALARVDLDRTRLSAETQENYIPRVLGSMMLRPGLEYISSTKDDAKAKIIPFIYGTDDTAFIEITNQNMRIYVDEAPITRASVSTAFTNGTFDADLANWTDVDAGAAVSDWASGGLMALTGTGYDAAVRRQQVTVAAGDTGTKHGIRVEVTQGEVTISVGTTAGDDDYFSLTLRPGTHSLAFTPTGSFWVDLTNANNYTSTLTSIAIESGTQDITAEWLEADLGNLRWDQSGNFIWVACDNYQPKLIKRHGPTSYSLEDFSPDDGPFRPINTTNIGLTLSATAGDINITSTEPFFKTTNVGGLIKISSLGQTSNLSANGADQWSPSIRVTGVDEGRIFDIDISGTWAGTVTLQRSVGEEGSWVDVDNMTWTGNVNTTYNDQLDNQIIYYRIGIKAGEYTSGTAVCDLAYSTGAGIGIARITEFNNVTNVSAIVLQTFGNTDTSTNWYEGEWSDRRGYPSAVALYDGRLAWAGNSKVWLSVSDAYASFSHEVEGDSGVISRTLGKGPIDHINWLFPGNRLVVGTDGLEASIRSSSFDEPLTPTQFSIKYPSNQGSAHLPAIQVDNEGIFVQRGGISVYRLVYSEATAYDYTSGEATKLAPEITEPGIVALASQRQPDTRIHFVRSDGNVAVWVNDNAEKVACWLTVKSDGASGEVEDVFVLPDPNATEDRVYYVVKRTINGSTVRYIEKWALESECQGGTLNKQADSFKYISQTASTTVSGLSHLEGESVVVWGDGKDLGFYTVSSGSITLSEAAAEIIVGLTYTAKFKSTKLAYAADLGSALTHIKKVDHLGLILHNTHKSGIQYGRDFDNLDDLPPLEDGVLTDDDQIWSSYDEVPFLFDGEFNTDSRICLQSQAPKPATILACTMMLKTNDRGL